MSESLQDARATEEKANELLDEIFGGAVQVELSVRYKNFSLRTGNAYWNTVGEWGDSPTEIVRSCKQAVADRPKIISYAKSCMCLGESTGSTGEPWFLEEG